MADALEQPPADRERWLDTACAGDSDLRQEVASLLAAHDSAGGFLSASAVEAPGMAGAVMHATREAQTLPAGRTVGPYRLVRELGRGGMGIVYLAVRADDTFDREVAIKVVRRGLADDRELRRFDAERRILAALDHPNIARLIDGGLEPDGVSYLVMEYVDGVPFDAYCESHRLPLQDRLRLFRDVCAAVSYAHRRLIIHRDIKPQNILVTADGTAKLLDFGIARLVSGDDAADRTRTALRAFTLAYASPEQVRGEPMTVTSDVYSLGVLLYRTVTGAHPYGSEERSDSAYIHAICEQPVVSPMTAARTATGLPVSEELEWVILAALRKEPERRYAGVEQLADDVGRLLDGLPVQAAPDSRTYRAGKFLRRHRVAAGAAALLAVSLLGGVGATLWQAREANRARQLAERRLANAQRLATAMVFEVNDALEQGTTAARALLLTRASEQLDALAAEAGDDGDLGETLAVAYHRLGDVLGQTGSANTGDRAAGRASHYKGLALRRAIAARRSASPDARQNLVRSLILTTYAEDEVEPSLRLAHEAVDVAERLVADVPAPLAYRRALANAYYTLGSQFRAIGDNVQALPVFEKSAPFFEAAHREAPSADTRRELALVHKRLGAILLDTDAVPQALPHLEAAVTLDEEGLAAAPSSSPRRRDLSTSLTQLGTGRQRQGDFPGAVAAFARAVELREAIFREDPSNIQAPRDLSSALRYLGEASAQAGHADTAVPMLERALALVRVIRKDDNLRALVLHSLAVTLRLAGHPAQAIARWREALEADLEQIRGQPENLAFRRVAAAAVSELAGLLREQGTPGARAEACRVLTSGMELFAPVLRTPDPGDTDVMAGLREAAVGCDVGSPTTR
ncbi:MAG: serine/threonine-protein kinase [Vicinamibacterales bacterium]